MNRTTTIIAYIKLMRLHTPTGIWLVMWPAYFGAALGGATPWDNPSLYALLTLGAIVMRSAGCVINDIWDRHIDSHVARTKSRPLAAKDLSVHQALFCLAGLCGAGLGLLWQFDPFVRVIGMCFAVLIALYPLAKRVTALPQIILAITINGGALMAYAAISGTLDASIWWLYAACCCWTMGYDTIYAHQDARDDAVLGIGSSALFFQRYTQPALAALYFALLFCTIIALRLEFIDFATLILGVCAAMQLAYQIVRLQPEDPRSCRRMFASNALFGALLFATILAHKMMI